MSCSAIIVLGGSTANWQEAFCTCVSLALRKHTTKAMSPHKENYRFVWISKFTQQVSIVYLFFDP